jgi:2-dehydro-3-deoxyglucarate aldolase
MILKKNQINIKKFRKNLKLKKVLLGGWMQISNPDLTELVCDSNYSWVAFDMEHGSFSISDLPNLFRSVELYNKLTFVRLPNKRVDLCAQVLDAGCSGIIIPNIKNKKELKKIIDNMYLPPLGSRGVGYSRANNYGKKFEEYKIQKEKPIIVPMIENIESVKKLDEIISVKGVDAILIGPYDLSASMGITGKFNNIKFKNAINRIKIITKKFKMPLGIHVVNPEYKNLKKFIKSGYQFIPYATDTSLVNTAIKEAFKR